MDVRLKTADYEHAGKKYVICCNMNVLADVQEANDGDILGLLNGKATAKSILLFLAAMLNDYADSMGWPERFTAKSLGRGMRPSQLSSLIDLVMPLVTSSLKSSGEEDTEAEKN